MTPKQLLTIMPFAASRVEQYAPPLTSAMNEFDIDTPKREAAFLAQVAHESGSLKYTEEIADGSAYNGRIDLGNTEPGDGPRYKGRGLLQVTGRSNYRQCGLAIGLPLIEQPSILALPVNACRSAAWFWRSRNLNQYADADQFGGLTKKINGGFNGLDDRIKFWLTARRVLGV